MKHSNPRELTEGYIKNPKQYSKQRGEGYLPAFFKGNDKLVFVSRKGYKTALLAK